MIRKCTKAALLYVAMAAVGCIALIGCDADYERMRRCQITTCSEPCLNGVQLHSPRCQQCYRDCQEITR